MIAHVATNSVGYAIAWAVDVVAGLPTRRSVRHRALRPQRPAWPGSLDGRESVACRADGPADRDVRLRVRRAHRRPGAVIDLLPAEDLVYIGDTGRYPYGPSRSAEVAGFARELAWSLVKDHDVKAVVVACNTAAAAGLDDLRAALPVPVLDVVEPGRAGARAGHAQRAGRRHRHRRHGRVGRLRARRRRRRRPGRRRAHVAAARASSSSSSAARPPATRSRCSPSGCWRRSGRRRRRAAARLHPLPVPRPGDRRRDGPGRDARSARPTRPPSPPAACSASSACCAPTATHVGEHRFLSSGDIDVVPRPRRPPARPRAQPHRTRWRPAHRTRRPERIAMPRPDGRAPDELRPITFERDFTEMAAGCVLVTFGRTRVLCTASIDEDVPRWMRGSGKGWVTAEYSMLPGLVARAGRPRGGQGQAERAHGRDPAADRPLPAGRVRHARARRAPGRRRLRRAAGRRRHAHGEHLRRLPRAARRPRPARRRRRHRRPTRCTRTARRSASASSAARRCSTCPYVEDSRPRST